MAKKKRNGHYLHFKYFFLKNDAILFRDNYHIIKIFFSGDEFFSGMVLMAATVLTKFPIHQALGYLVL